jgi:hypothetical protein
VNKPEGGNVGRIPLELDGMDMRAAPIEERKDVLADPLRSPHDSIAFNENFSSDGATIYKHARTTRLRVYRQQAARFALSRWPLGALDQGQESQGARGEARSRRGLELTEIKRDITPIEIKWSHMYRWVMTVRPGGRPTPDVPRHQGRRPRSLTSRGNKLPTRPEPSPLGVLFCGNS